MPGQEDPARGGGSQQEGRAISPGAVPADPAGGGGSQPEGAADPARGWQILPGAALADPARAAGPHQGRRRISEEERRIPQE